MESDKPQKPGQETPISTCSESKSQQSEGGIPSGDQANLHFYSLLEQHNASQHQNEIREQKRDAIDRKRLRVEKATVWVGVAGILGLLFNLCETRRSVNTAVDALHSQRPYISLGRADGIVADYVAPAKGGGKGAVRLYFQNTGSVAATNFLMNAARRLPHDSPLRPQKEPAQRHIERWLIFREGKRLGKGFTMGATVGANSIKVEFLHPDWTPTPEEWKLITIGKSEKTFQIAGNLEYCDSWGYYHCEMFDIDYRPVPVSRFVAETMACPWDSPLPRDSREYARGPGYTSKLLPACEQPEERSDAQK